MKKILFFVLFLLIFSFRLDSQVFINKSKPLSKIKQSGKDATTQARIKDLNGLSDISTIPKEHINLFSATRLDEILSNIKRENSESNPIAIPIKTNFNTSNSGKWDTLANGDRVWRLYLDLTQNNTSILVFKKLSIPYGGFLHIFDKEEDMSFGPITFNTNSDGGGWMTHVLPFSNIVLEYVQPRDVLGNPKIVISKVAQMITNNVDSVFSNNKVNSVQGKMPPIGFNKYGTDYYDINRSVTNMGSPIACLDTLESYSRSVIQYIYLYRALNSNEYDHFDAKNGVLLATTNPTDCKSYIATVSHVAWQDSIMMNDFLAFRFNWKREKPINSCCVYPNTLDSSEWANTIDYSEIVDYCGGTRRVYWPSNSQNVTADFALVEMNDYPVHNAYFSDWNASCLEDSSSIELKWIGHRTGGIPMMYKLGNLSFMRCSNNMGKSESAFSFFPYDCNSEINLYSGDSGSGLFKKKYGFTINDYEYIGATKSNNNAFTSLNWAFDTDIPSNRPKTYLDPINTGLLKAIGYNANPICQTADCCELIYTKLRPFDVQVDINDSCCTTLIIEERFPDDITCGDYRVVVKNIETNRVVVEETITKDDIKYPNRLEYEICEELPPGFSRSKVFEYSVKFIQDSLEVLTCSRNLAFNCKDCKADSLEITLLPRLGEDCCYDVKIKELSEDACQFQHILIKQKGETIINNELYTYDKYVGRYSSPNSSIIGINQDSLFIREICLEDGAESIIIELFDSSLEFGTDGYPLIPQEESFIKRVFFDISKDDNDHTDYPCNCCENLKIEKDPMGSCNDFIVTQSNFSKFYENCGHVDSIRVDLTDDLGRLITSNIYNQGGLSIDSINHIDINSTISVGHSKFIFYLYDENGNLICTKEEISTDCESECIDLGIILENTSKNDDDPCCQIIKFYNSTGISNVVVDIYKVELVKNGNANHTGPINPTPIILNTAPVGFEICVDEEDQSFYFEYRNGSEIICRKYFILSCNSCCTRNTEVTIEFIKTDSDSTCCYTLNYELDTSEGCPNNPSYMRVINIGPDILEYEGSLSGMESQEFCNESDTTLKYKIEFFNDDDYALESRVCIEEAEIKPCSEHCCDNAYIEAVKDTSIKNPLVCCWKFNVLDYNCEVYRVEVYDDYTNTNMWEHMRPDGSFDLLFNKKRSELYNYGDTSFLPYYTEGLLPSDSLYLSNGPIDLETLSDRITSNICISNDNTSQSGNGVSHDNVKIRLFGPNGEECILDKELKCIPSQLCCNYVTVRTVKVIDSLNPDNCCWKIGVWINEWVPPFCKTGALNFKKLEMYRDVYNITEHKYYSELYPLNIAPFFPLYTNNSLDTIGNYANLLSQTPMICQTPGTNPTDKIIILLVNADGDTCIISGQLNYCPTIAEYAIEYTSSFNNNEKLNLDNLSIKIDDIASKLSFKLKGIKINDYEILIYDMVGKKHITYQGETVNEDIIDISSLNSGVYYFVYRANGQVITKIFTIVK